MASDSSVLHNMNEMKKGPYKLEYPMSNQRYDLGNEKSSLPDNKVDNEPDAQKAGNGKYNINPNHMHKINAIINLLEDLNLENLIHIKNQIMKMVKK